MTLEVVAATHAVQRRGLHETICRVTLAVAYQFRLGKKLACPGHRSIDREQVGDLHENYTVPYENILFRFE